MTLDTLSIGSGLGGIAFWNTRRCSRALAHAAADQAGIGHLVPAAPPRTTALRTCMLDVAKRLFGRVRKSPISVRELEQTGTFEAVRVIPGVTANSYRHLFSAVYSNPDLWQVRLLTAAPYNIPDLEAKLQAAIHEERDYLPATIVSQIMVRALREWRATLLKDDGGVWFVPGPYLERYRSFAKHIGGKGVGPQFKLTQFEISSDPDTVGHVLSALRDEIRSSVDVIMDDVMRAEGGLKDRSIAIREKKAAEFLQKVQLYERLTGRTLTDLTDAISKAQQALAINKLLSVSA